MATTPNNGIYYPVATDAMTPLASRFAALATSVETALDNNYKFGGLRGYSSSTARSTAIPSPVAGQLVFRTDRQWVEQYMAADVTVSPNRPAGWYPVSGQMPKVELTGTIAIANNGIVPLNLTEVNDPFGLFTTSGTTVTLPSIHGRWRMESVVTWPVNSTGARLHSINYDSAVSLGTNIIGGDNRPAFNESWSTISKEIVLLGGNAIRVWGGQTSGGSLTPTSKITIAYLGPA